MNSFVSVIRQDGEPGPLFGPYDYMGAQQVMLGVLKSNRIQNGPIEITAAVLRAVELDGIYTFEGGGGVYIIQSEGFTPDDDEANYKFGVLNSSTPDKSQGNPPESNYQSLDDFLREELGDDAAHFLS